MCPTPRKRSTRQATKSAANGIKAEDDVVATDIVKTSAESKVSVKASASKRKVEEDAYESEKDDGKAKKRKTGKATKGAKKKDEDMRPLVARTVVETLKKGMYIGAHVSSAGGTSSPHNLPPTIKQQPLTRTTSRRPQLPPKRDTRRRQRIRPVPEVSTQMDEPAPRPRRPRPVPLSRD